jgi:hypothetical protein
VLLSLQVPSRFPARRQNPQSKPHVHKAQLPCCKTERKSEHRESNAERLPRRSPINDAEDAGKQTDAK